MIARIETPDSRPDLKSAIAFCPCAGFAFGSHVASIQDLTARVFRLPDWPVSLTIFMFFSPLGLFSGGPPGTVR